MCQRREESPVSPGDDEGFKRKGQGGLLALVLEHVLEHLDLLLVVRHKVGRGRVAEKPELRPVGEYLTERRSGTACAVKGYKGYR
jgi:hypothetical protein